MIGICQKPSPWTLDEIDRAVPDCAYQLAEIDGGLATLIDLGRLVGRATSQAATQAHRDNVH